MPVRTLASISELNGLIGQELGVTDWLTVAQNRIQRFAEATEDRQWIHVDPERARRESPYGGTIAHGFLTLSLLSHFMKQVIDIQGVRMGVNYGLNRVRFPAAVLADTRIRARVALQSIKEISGGCEAILLFTVEGEGLDKPCCVAEWIVRFYS